MMYLKSIPVFLLVFLSLSACGSDPNVEMVKNGKLESCPSKTLDQMTKDFMASPSWEGGKTEEGEIFVNVSGGITYSEKEVDATVQFMVSPEDKTFKFNAMEFNGVPQNALLVMGLLEKMCEAKSR